MPSPDYVTNDWRAVKRQMRKSPVSCKSGQSVNSEGQFWSSGCVTLWPPNPPPRTPPPTPHRLRYLSFMSQVGPVAACLGEGPRIECHTGPVRSSKIHMSEKFDKWPPLQPSYLSPSVTLYLPRHAGGAKVDLRTRLGLGRRNSDCPSDCWAPPAPSLKMLERCNASMYVCCVCVVCVCVFCVCVWVSVYVCACVWILSTDLIIQLFVSHRSSHTHTHTHPHTDTHTHTKHTYTYTHT